MASKKKAVECEFLPWECVQLITAPWRKAFVSSVSVYSTMVRYSVWNGSDDWTEFDGWMLEPYAAPTPPC